MVAKIAWKNIWRNRLRSLMLMISIILGIWAATFITAFVFGMIEQRVDDAIGYEISHAQVHHPDFQIDNESQFFIFNTQEVLEKIYLDERVQAASGRVIAFGMVTAPKTSASGKFIGIDPEKENAVIKLADRIVEGEYLNEKDKNKVIVGKKLAEKLKLKLRSKIVLTLQDKDRNIVAGAFRIKGIFKSSNSTIEENNLYVRDKDLGQLLVIGDQVHEIAVLMHRSEQVDPFVEAMMNSYTGLKIQSWREIAPELALMIESLDQYMVILLVIILLALSFGIVNTMLMAVLERVREIGVLMAIGMNKIRIFGMIFFETLMIIGLAAPLGLLLGYITVAYFGSAGLDVSGLYKEGYQAFGFGGMVYLHLESFYYFRILFLVAITALLASIYPAITALRLNPVTAIRKL